MTDRTKITLAVLSVVIPALAIVLAAVLPDVLRQEPPCDVPTEEDIAVLDELRPLFSENQLINAEYAELAKSDVGKGKVDEFVVQFDDFLRRKETLLNRLKAIPPSPCYARVRQSFIESAASDLKLLGLQKSYVETLPQHTKEMREVEKQRSSIALDPSGMTDDQKRAAVAQLTELRDRLVEIQAWTDRNTAERKLTRSSSIAAIGILNAELRERDLPYEHVNVFEETDPLEDGPPANDP